MQHCSGSVQICDVYNFLRYFWERERKWAQWDWDFWLTHSCMPAGWGPGFASLHAVCVFTTDWVPLLQEAIAKLLRFESSKSEPGERIGLDDYASRMKAGERNIYFLSTPRSGGHCTFWLDWLHACCCSDATPLWFRKSCINPEFMLKWLHDLRLILRDEHWIPVSPFLFRVKRHTSGGQPMIYYLIWEMKYKNGKMDIIMS